MIMNYLYCIFFIYLLPLSTCTLRTYEFGDNYGVVSFARAGHMDYFEKVVKIPVVLSPCNKLTYVRVDIDNVIPSPEVTFDYDTSIVVISHGPLWASSALRYWVTAKSIPDVLCLAKYRE